MTDLAIDPGVLARVLEALPSAVIVAAADGTVAFANRACHQLLVADAEVGHDAISAVASSPAWPQLAPLVVAGPTASPVTLSVDGAPGCGDLVASVTAAPEGGAIVTLIPSSGGELRALLAQRDADLQRARHELEEARDEMRRADSALAAVVAELDATSAELSRRPPEPA